MCAKGKKGGKGAGVGSATSGRVWGVGSCLGAWFGHLYSYSAPDATT